MTRHMKKEDLIKFYLIHRSQIFPAVVVLASLFLIVFVIYPQTAKLISNQKAIDGLVNKSRFLETKVAALESLNGDDLSRKVGFVLAALPPDKDYGNILSLLQQRTAQLGFSINSVTFGSSANKLENLSSFEVKLDIKGVQANFETLLNNLENSSRIVRINSIDIPSKQIAQAFEASLAVEVLYSKLPQSFGSVDSPLPELSQKDEQLISRLEGLGGTVSTSSAAESPRGKSNPFE